MTNRKTKAQQADKFQVAVSSAIGQSLNKTELRELKKWEYLLSHLWEEEGLVTLFRFQDWWVEVMLGTLDQILVTNHLTSQQSKRYNHSNTSAIWLALVQVVCKRNHLSTGASWTGDWDLVLFCAYVDLWNKVKIIAMANVGIRLMASKKKHP